MPTELELLEWIEKLEQDAPEGLRQGIGDDCAVFALGREGLVVTTDLLVEDVHFERSRISPRFLGRKALLVNLSDIAAVGALPYACLLGLSIPKNLADGWVQEFLQGFLEETRTWSCPLVGGDLSNAAVVVASVTVLGRLPVGTEICRFGAQAGDSILVVGPLGLSRRGLEDILDDESGGLAKIDTEESLDMSVSDKTRAECLKAHWLPFPQVEAGVWLRERSLANAMLDVSDGLAIDLLRLARASGLKAVLDLRLLGRSASEHSCLELDYLLNGGEDYALLFTTDSAKLEVIRRDYPASLPAFRVIGRMEEGTPQLLLEDSQGIAACQPLGYDHFR